MVELIIICFMQLQVEKRKRIVAAKAEAMKKKRAEKKRGKKEGRESRLWATFLLVMVFVVSVH